MFSIKIIDLKAVKKQIYYYSEPYNWYKSNYQHLFFKDTHAPNLDFINYEKIY